MTLRPHRPASRSILRAVAAAPGPLRHAAAVKRTLLDHGEDRSTLTQAGTTPLDTEGSQKRMRMAAALADTPSHLGSASANPVASPE
jgi:hypothetical protein